MQYETIPDIVLLYPSNFPEELIIEEVEKIKAPNINIKIVKNENEPYSAFEWIIPTAFGVYILKPYFEGFLSEMGKDHYTMLKNGLKIIVEKGKFIKPKLIVASKSTKKISNKYNQSLSVSVIIQTKNNRQIKLLFDNDLEKEDWDNAIDQLLDFVIENYENYPNDSLTKKINIFNDESRKIIYGKINPTTKIVDFFDDQSLAAEFRNKKND